MSVSIKAKYTPVNVNTQTQSILTENLVCQNHSPAMTFTVRITTLP